MQTTTEAIARALADGVLSRRLWLYSNYHCNLACTYCLTDSAPGVARRELPAEQMVALAEEARSLGFTGLGVTGGEPFMRPDMPEVLAWLARVLPVVVLSNGTLLVGRRLEKLRQLRDLPVKIQISLDHAEARDNDAGRGEGSFSGAVEAMGRLRRLGLGVRVATTGDTQGPAERERLCALHRDLGIDEADHVVRPVVRRGRAAERALGAPIDRDQLSPELTVSVDGAFWSPFGPSVTGGELDTDLRISEAIRPLSVPAAALLSLVEQRPQGADAALGIR